jgi:hypothetical protein
MRTRCRPRLPQVAVLGQWVSPLLQSSCALPLMLPPVLQRRRGRSRAGRALVQVEVARSAVPRQLGSTNRQPVRRLDCRCVMHRCSWRWS